MFSMREYFHAPSNTEGYRRVSVGAVHGRQSFPSFAKVESRRPSAFPDDDEYIRGSGQGNLSYASPIYALLPQVCKADPSVNKAEELARIATSYS